MSNQFSTKCKDASPESTVEKIQKILKSLNIEMVEEWADENEIDTYSLRLHLKNCDAIGSNGKGMSRAYAQASAYAEFMERLENHRIVTNRILFHHSNVNGSGPIISENEAFLSIDELVTQESEFLRHLYRDLGVLSDDMEGRKKVLTLLQRMDYMVHQKYRQFLCMPFYSCKKIT